MGLLDAPGISARTFTRPRGRDLLPSRLLARQVMASASQPTVTQGTANAASTISGNGAASPNTLAGSMAVTWLGGAAIGHPPGAYPLTNVWAPLNRAADVNGQSWGHSYAIEFMWADPGLGKLGIQLLNKGGGYRISIDDQYLSSSLSATLMTNDNSFYEILLDFTAVGGAATPKKIRFETSMPLAGLNLGATATIWPTKPRGPRCVYMGDSYTDGSAQNQTGITTYVRTVGDLLGWDDVWNSAVGSTGYLARSSGQTNNTLDAVSGVTPYSPDVVIVSSGHNDTDTNANVGTQAGLVFQQLRAALPNALLICQGPYFTGGAAQLSSWAAKESAIFTAVAPFADITIPQASGSGVPWFTGTGRVGATTGSGNSDYFVGTDSIHPTQAGHDYIGHRLAYEIKSRLPR